MMRSMGRICGFVGIDDKQLLLKMCKVQSQSGRINYFIDKEVGICSEASEEPFSIAQNEDGNVFCAFDGEIYNKTALNKFLNERGHEILSCSGSELMVHLYEECGDFFVKDIRGSFAFALWDSEREKLLLVRDRSGERPLFYTLMNKVLYFASEIKSLLRNNCLRKQVNTYGLELYFSWGHVPAPYTLFKGIMKIPPAHMMVYDNHLNNFVLKRYWKLEFSDINYKLDEDSWCKIIYDALRESVHIRLKKPPFGILLGGVDSTSLASVMKKLTSEPINSFTVYLDDEQDDEPYAQYAAEWLGLNYHKQVLCADDVIKILPHIIYLFEDPKADMSASLPTYVALKLASKFGVKSIFSADGADSIFWGNPPCSFRQHPSWKELLISKIPKNLRKGILPIFYSLIHKIPISQQEDNIIAGEIKSLSNICFLMDGNHIFNKKERQELLRSSQYDVFRPFSNCLELKEKLIMNLWDQVRLLNKIAETAGWGIERLQCFSEAFGLCPKLPFEDHTIKEIASKIPPHLKQPTQFIDKYIWRKTILKYNLCPREIIFKQKSGFGEKLERNVMAKWINGPLQDYVNQQIYGVIRHVKPFFKSKGIKKLLTRAKTHQKFALLVFAIWYKTFFLND